MNIVIDSIFFFSFSKYEIRFTEIYEFWDHTGECIDADGIERLCGDVGVSTLDPVTLALCYHLNAAQMGTFEKYEK